MGEEQPKLKKESQSLKTTAKGPKKHQPKKKIQITKEASKTFFLLLINTYQHLQKSKMEVI